MKVLWRSDLDQGKHDPLEITHVVTKSGSQISAALVVLAVDHLGSAWARVGDVEQFTPSAGGEETAGLLEVIEAQLVAIDEINQNIKAGILDAGLAKELSDLQEWADQFPDMIADLCVALGYAAHPVGPTGIPELDILVSLSR